MSNVYRSSISARLEIENVGNFDIISYSDDFALNAIPSASCVIPVGRDATQPSKAADINRYGDRLTQMARAKVYAKISGDFGASKKWPESEQLIFDGRLARIGLKKSSTGSIQFVLHLVHWLADLAFASTLSEQSHPANPAELTYAANAPWRLQTSGGGGGLPVFVNQLSGMEFLADATKIATDMWGEALQPFFCELANRDTIEDKQRGLRGLSGSRQTNKLALDALSRMEGGGCGRSRSSGNVPLSFSFGGSDAIRGSVAKAIAASVGTAAVSSFASTTIWDLLVGELSPRFLFGVTPLVDTAYVVPIIPGLRTVYDVPILADDYNYVDLTGSTPRPIRGVGIYGNIQSKTGARDPGNGPLPATIGGYFSPDGADSGMFMFKRAPDWLNNILPFSGSVGRTSGVDRKLAIATTTTIAEDDTRGGDDGKTQADTGLDAVDIFNAVAKGIYINEMLRNRSGMVSGKLRFDIAPGSNVKIQGSAEQFLGESDVLASNLVGTVVRVSSSFSADPPSAGTGFQVAHLRTEQENGRDATSVDSHPLFDSKFLGAPLVEAYKI